MCLYFPPGAGAHDRGPAGGAVGGAGQAGHVGRGRSPAGAHAERLPALRHGVLQGAVLGHFCEIKLLSSSLNRPSAFSWALLKVSELFFSTKQFPVSVKLKMKTYWENPWRISNSIRMWSVVL